MKFTTVVSIVGLLATSAYATEATPDAGQHAKAILDYCNQPGGHCDKLKRAADAAASALAAAEPEANPYWKFPIVHFCHLPGQGCSKAKRAAEDLSEAVKSAYAAVDTDGATAAEAEAYCNQPGAPCDKVKRAAEAIAEALAAPEPAANPNAEAYWSFPITHFCHLPGQGCSKAKRAADDLAKVAANAVSSL